jgi:hypothetical protein
MTQIMDEGFSINPSFMLLFGANPFIPGMGDLNPLPSRMSVL